MTTLGLQVLNLGAAQQAIGVDVAVFASDVAPARREAFVEFGGLLEAATPLNRSG